MSMLKTRKMHIFHTVTFKGQGHWLFTEFLESCIEENLHIVWTNVLYVSVDFGKINGGDLEMTLTLTPLVKVKLVKNRS